MAGSAIRRARVLEGAFADPEVRLVVPATGGTGVAQLLEVLDFEVLAQHPTVLTGMSDPSILVNAVHARTGLRTLHGPSGYDFFRRPVSARTETAFWTMVTGAVRGQTIHGSVHGDNAWRVVRGAGSTVSGPVFGGHLSTLRRFIDTPWMPHPTGAILLLEEAFTPWPVIDRVLAEWRLGGGFDDLAALLVGVPIGCGSPAGAGSAWDAMILRNVPGTFPVVTNVPFGHTAEKIPFVIGGRLELDTTAPVTTLRYRDDLVRTGR